MELGHFRGKCIALTAYIVKKGTTQKNKKR